MGETWLGSRGSLGLCWALGATLLANLVACTEDSLASCPADLGERSTLAGAPSEGPLRMQDVLLAMRDLDGYVRFDDSVRSVRLSSSYDRGSERGDWYANLDIGNYVEENGTERVLLDAEGPGIVTRIWSANPSGIMRIEVDGDVVLEGPMEDVLAGARLPLTDEHAFLTARGHNLYLPIPYQERCRVIVDTERPLYYHVTYRTLAPTVSVEPFSFDAALRALCALGERSASTARPGAAAAPVEETSVVATIDSDPSSDDALILTAPEGGGVVRELRFEAGALTDEELRGTELTIRVDDEMTVRAPLGDFFNGGPGLRPFASRVSTVLEGGVLIARWPMPFSRSLTVALRAANARPVVVPARVVVEPQAFTEDTLLFRARFLPPTPVTVTDAAGRATPSDLRLLEVVGRGLYTGVMLDLADPSKSWWGEGDEKITVDGEDFPSHFGTGTEDYFGWAWCSTEQYANEHVGQIRARVGDNGGYVSAYRWHGLDAIPFRRSLVFDLEVLHWSTADPSVEVTYDAVVFFYAAPGAMVLGPEASDADFRIPDLPEALTGPSPAVEPYRCGGG